MHKVKIITLEQYIEYRNKIVTRQRSRKKHFASTKKSYYDIRLEQLDEAYPQFSKLGIINLKGNV